jgi:hypothetical protein
MNTKKWCPLTKVLVVTRAFDNEPAIGEVNRNTTTSPDKDFNPVLPGTECIETKCAAWDDTISKCAYFFSSNGDHHQQNSKKDGAAISVISI